MPAVMEYNGNVRGKHSSVCVFPETGTNNWYCPDNQKAVVVKMWFFLLSRATAKLTDLELRWPHGFIHPQISHVGLTYLFLNSDGDWIFSFWKLLNIIPFSFMPVWITVLKNLIHKLINIFSDMNTNIPVLCNLTWFFFFLSLFSFVFISFWVFFTYSLNMKTSASYSQYRYS